MKPFKFRLATLMKIRETMRDQRRAQLAQAYQADAILQQRQHDLQAELEGLVERNREAARPGPVQIDTLLETQRYELVVRTLQTQTHTQRRAVAAEIAERRKVLVEADRQVRVLEKLKERQVRHHREEEDRQETKRLDEVAGLRAAREEMQ